MSKEKQTKKPVKRKNTNKKKKKNVNKPRLSKRGQEWEQEEKLTLITGWAKEGLSDEQIANNMGVARSKLFDCRKSSELISNALKKGKEVTDYEVENAMYKSAIGYNVKVAKQFKLKTVSYIDGNRHEKEELVEGYEEIHVPANVTAQIFWTKNRKPDLWKDRVDVAEVQEYEVVEIENDIK